MGVNGVVNSESTVSEDLCFGSWGRPWPAAIGEECLSAAEEAADQVLSWVHPTLDSEEKRRDVVEYVQQLVQTRLDCEVVSYGSVPLKTYLPDGDIDLTVLKGPSVGESLAHDVLALLLDEAKNEKAEYQVKDTQFIDAEVKLVKCFVRNFVIDISFNQLGGLSTLCFLEKVDRLVGRDHLFKRSIILIKTWCYYESRILGAHHGLISTYALEVLVLYIFHHFHSSLSGPLSALHVFLEYYTQFDWENYCISLNGPVSKSSLPDIIVMMPEGGQDNLLLGKEFLDDCLELFSVPSGRFEADQKAFQPKLLNIIDPLREDNNLGRSVNKGNFYRIRSAFKFGFHKLTHVLSLPRDKVADKIYDFFTNTLARHEHQYKTSIRLLAMEFGNEDPFSESLSSPVDLLSEDDILLNSSITDLDSSDFRNEVDRHSICPSKAFSSTDGVFVSGCWISEAKQSLATCSSTNEASENSKCRASLSDNNHFGKSKSFTENGSPQAAHQFDLSASTCLENNKEKLAEMNNTYQWCLDSSITKSGALENATLDNREMDSGSIGGDSEAFNPLADLSGDCDGNIRSWLRGQISNGFSLAVNKPSSSSSPPGIQNIKPWDTVRQSMPLKVDKNNDDKSLSQVIPYTVSTDQTPLAGSDFCFFGNSFHFDGAHKARGTGTYFPQMNFLCTEMPSNGRGKNKLAHPGNENYLHNRNRHRNYGVREYSSFDNDSSHEVVPGQESHLGRKRRSDVQSQSNCSDGGGNRKNGPCRIEFGSIGNLGEELISTTGRVRVSKMAASMKPMASTSVLMQQRGAGQFIHLKNEDEFPPLCQ